MTRTRRSARPAPLPRLPNKQKRLPGYAALPRPVRDGIESIARREGWSRSRVIAWLVCDWFGLDADTGAVIRDNRRPAAFVHSASVDRG